MSQRIYLGDEIGGSRAEMEMEEDGEAGNMKFEVAGDATNLILKPRGASQVKLGAPNGTLDLVGAWVATAATLSATR